MSTIRHHPLLNTFLQLEVGSLCFTSAPHNSWRSSLNRNLLAYVKSLPIAARGRFLDSAFRTIDNQIYWLDLRGSQECYLYNSHTHEVILPAYKIPITHFRRCRSLRNECLRGVQSQLFAPGLESVAPPHTYPLVENIYKPEYTQPIVAAPLFVGKTLEEKIAEFLSPSNDKTELTHVGKYSQEFCDEMEQKYPTLAFIPHPNHIQIL